MEPLESSFHTVSTFSVLFVFFGHAQKEHVELQDFTTSSDYYFEVTTVISTNGLNDFVIFHNCHQIASKKNLASDFPGQKTTLPNQYFV